LKNTREFFAEHMTAYLYQPTDLKKINPEVYGWFNRLTKDNPRLNAELEAMNDWIIVEDEIGKVEVTDANGKMSWVDDETEAVELGGKGSGFFGHKGRDAENLRGGSVAKGTSAKADIAPPKQTNEKEIKQIAASLGHDPKKVNVYIAEGRDFMVNGKHFTTAGTYSPETDEIEIFGLYNMTTNEAKGIVAHEVMHGKFERFNDLAKAQMDEIRSIPDWDKVVIRADGSLRDGYEKYWAYDLQYNYINKFETMEHLQKTDGITDYSRAWWGQVNQFTDTKYRAINETLSEIARAEIWGTLSSDEIDPEWFKLYNRIKYGQ